MHCISPGYVWTPLVEKQIPNTMKARNLRTDQVISDAELAAQPTKERAGGFAGVVFVQPGRRAVTGANLSIDGGWTAV